MASQIISVTIVYSTVYSDAHQSSASLAFVRGIHRWPVNSPQEWPVMHASVHPVGVGICMLHTSKLPDHMLLCNNFVVLIRYFSFIQVSPQDTSFIDFISSRAQLSFLINSKAISWLSARLTLFSSEFHISEGSRISISEFCSIHADTWSFYSMSLGVRPDELVKSPRWLGVASYPDGILHWSQVIRMRYLSHPYGYIGRKWFGWLKLLYQGNNYDLSSRFVAFTVIK